MNLTERLNQWAACDEAREGIPGEHAIVAAAGGALIVSALFAPSAFRATLRAMLGGALLVRAASGRDGLACWMPGLAGTSASASADSKAAGPWPFPKSPPASPEPANPPAEAAPYDGA